MERENNYTLLQDYEFRLRDRKLWIAEPLIDPRLLIPVWPQRISKFIKKLGGGALDIELSSDKCTVIFPGGEVVYSFYPNITKLIPNNVTLYAATAEPGKRSISKYYDTNMYFDILEIDECSNIKVDEETYFYAPNDHILSVRIEDPKEIDLRNYWLKE